MSSVTAYNKLFFAPELRHWWEDSPIGKPNHERTRSNQFRAGTRRNKRLARKARSINSQRGVGL